MSSNDVMFKGYQVHYKSVIYVQQNCHAMLHEQLNKPCPYTIKCISKQPER